VQNAVHLPDHREDPRLVIIISICAHTKVDLLRESIKIVGGRQFKDTVGSIPDQTVSREQIK